MQNDYSSCLKWKQRLMKLSSSLWPLLARSRLQPCQLLQAVSLFCCPGCVPVPVPGFPFFRPPAARPPARLPACPPALFMRALPQWLPYTRRRAALPYTRALINEAVLGACAYACSLDHWAQPHRWYPSAGGCTRTRSHSAEPVRRRSSTCRPAVCSQTIYRQSYS